MQWYKDGIAVIGATARTLSATTSGTYSVKTTSNGITTTSPGILVTAITVPVPIITLNVSNDLTSSAATGNQWYFNGNLIAGANSQIYHPTQSGIYTVRDTLNNCVSDFSAAYNFVVTGIIDLGNNQYIRVYPNPVKTNLHLDWYMSAMPTLNIEVRDLQGRRILYSRNLHNAATLDLSKFPASIYFINISNDKLQIHFTMKIIKKN